MWDWKRKLAMVAAPAMMAVGATAVSAYAATPGASPETNVLVAAPSTATPNTAAEAPEVTTPETVEGNEPALPGGSHSDPAGQADYQFDGVE